MTNGRSSQRTEYPGEDRVPKSVRQQYTDILAHDYEPNGGHHLAVGTNFGELSIVLVDPKLAPSVRSRPRQVQSRRSRNVASGDEEPDDDVDMDIDFSAQEDDAQDAVVATAGGGGGSDHLATIAKFQIPCKSAILGLNWGDAGIFVGTRSAIYLYNWNGETQELDSRPSATINCPFDVMDICGVQNSAEKLVLACDDSKSRVYDMSAQKLVAELQHHTGIVEVCVSSEEHVATGAHDGIIQLYDAEFRTTDPVQSFNHDKVVINNIALNKSSTWLAAVGHGFDAPKIHNVRSGKTLTDEVKMENPLKVYAVTFDRRGYLYWGGEGGIVFKSEGLTDISAQFKTKFGDGRISSVYSIATALTSYGGIRLSASGTGNGILISENSKYWSTFFRV